MGSRPRSRGCYGSLIGLAGRLRTGNVYDFYVLLEDGGLIIVDYCPDYRGHHSTQKKKNCAASEKKTEIVKNGDGHPGMEAG